jgi:3-hydroxybutyryl-CoA dehydrogenase
MEPRVIGIVGLGFLGRGIAACFLGNGFRIIAYDHSPQARQSARTAIQAAIEDLAQHGCISAQSVTGWRSLYDDPDTIQSLRDCDFVIESITESLETKHAAFDELESIVGSTVPIASNTSALPITMLQDHRRYPERFIGMHWAEPSHVSRFLEVIRGAKTSDATTDATMQLARRVGKEPSLVKRDVEGFIVNRLGYAMYREAFNLLEIGVADVETIDRAFRTAVGLWAAISGPFRWMDLTGISSYAAVMKRLFPKLSNKMEVPEIIQQLVSSGANGISNGRGFYSYTPEQSAQWHKLLTENAWQARSAGDLAASLEKVGDSGAQSNTKE